MLCEVEVIDVERWRFGDRWAPAEKAYDEQDHTNRQKQICYYERKMLSKACHYEGCLVQIEISRAKFTRQRRKR
jgi:hypothetical protein